MPAFVLYALKPAGGLSRGLEYGADSREADGVPSRKGTNARTCGKHVLAAMAVTTRDQCAYAGG